MQDPDQPRSIGQLGERLHVESATLTPLLKRLASMGYVTRSRDAEDERRVLVTLTADGLALRDRVAAVPESFLACLGLDVARASALRDQLTALAASLEAGARQALELPRVDPENHEEEDGAAQDPTCRLWTAGPARPGR